MDARLSSFDSIFYLYRTCADALVNCALGVHVQGLARSFLSEKKGSSDCSRDCLFIEWIAVFVGHHPAFLRSNSPGLTELLRFSPAKKVIALS